MAKQYLVVANQTLGGQRLLDVIRDRLGRGPAEFWVLVPATPATHLLEAFGALSGAFPIDAGVLQPADVHAREEGIATATENLDNALKRLRGIGAIADGEVGDPDPLTAIKRSVEQREFDEIILSTLPPGISRWLALDLPHRVRRKVDVPLTVVTAST